tara:strand:- start:370 stop:759 length:390 start_codon:yes stop_codon:yes gene_type:complete
MSIKRIIKEEMDWAKDVPTAFPKANDVYSHKISMDVTFFDYLKWNYDYTFVTVFFVDTPNVVEFVMENDVMMNKYDNIEVIDNSDSTTMEEYMIEHGQDELVEKYDLRLWEFLRKSFPFKIKGVSQGYL